MRSGSVTFYGLSSAILLAILMAVTVSCKEQPKTLVLAGFESEADLDGLVWECHRWFETDREYITHGENSLKVEASPSKEPLFRIFMNDKKNWTEYDRFSLDVYSVNDENIHLAIRFIDNNSQEDSGQYYTKKIIIHEGWNNISVPVDEISNGPVKRRLELSNMKKVAMLLGESGGTHTLYFDNFMLSKEI